MNESYAALYQEFLMEPRTKEAGDLIAQKMFTHRLYFEDKKVRYVIVRHSQMEQEEIYTCVAGAWLIQESIPQTRPFFSRMTSSADTVLLWITA